VLFEIATLGPGFAVDEDPAHLGESLVLPPWFEAAREDIERALPTLTPPSINREAPARPGSGQA
jgi:glyoxalase family protein